MDHVLGVHTSRMGGQQRQVGTRGQQRGRKRFLATVLFTDIVGSTDLASELGDVRWRELLARHHALVRRQLKLFGGREVDTAGDGFFAVFQVPADAVRCACAVAEAVHELGIDIRAGLHVGECEQMGDKVGGIAVHTGARVLAAASPAEVLVTGTIRELVAGSGIGFEDRGIHALKGIPGEWRLLGVTGLDGTTRPGPLEPEAAAALREGIVPALFLRRKRAPVLAVAGALVAAMLGVGLFLGTRSSPRPHPSTHPAASRSNSLWRLDPDTGRVTAAIPVGTEPLAVAVGEGSVWVVDSLAGAVSRIDPVTNHSVSIPVGQNPVALTVADGSVWVVLQDSVVPIDPATNRAGTPMALGARGLGITAANGSVWVTDDEGIVQIDPATSSIVKRIAVRTVNTFLQGGPDGPIAVWGDSAWVTAFTHVYWVDLKTSHFVDVSPRSQEFCDVKAGTDAVWLLGCTARGAPGNPGAGPAAVFRLDPATGHVGKPIPVENGGQWLALDATNVWVLSSTGQVSRIDQSDSAVHPFGQAGSSIGGIVVGAGSLWVTVDMA
jgi:class 3 adenylate cyclase